MVACCSTKLSNDIALNPGVQKLCMTHVIVRGVLYQCTLDMGLGRPTSALRASDTFNRDGSRRTSGDHHPMQSLVLIKWWNSSRVCPVEPTSFIFFPLLALPDFSRMCSESREIEIYTSGVP
ncbi:hypothetical protein VNO77_04156 [Canavalia gladiata]|uniref:Uncharacterized protein n=1 Tax=Canavalia gladiata TaxID=3824 RepID=A0AAN9MWV3_CANGL